MIIEVAISSFDDQVKLATEPWSLQTEKPWFNPGRNSVEMECYQCIAVMSRPTMQISGTGKVLVHSSLGALAHSGHRECSGSGSTFGAFHSDLIASAGWERSVLLVARIGKRASRCSLTKVGTELGMGFNYPPPLSYVTRCYLTIFGLHRERRDAL